MKVMIVVGARPNFMKAGPLISAIREHNRKGDDPASSTRAGTRAEIRHLLVHTGQHYDEAMSRTFFTDLGLPEPDVYLGVGSGSHASQTAEIMKRFEEVILREKPDAIVVVGDVNSTLACTLVAAKISFNSDGTQPLIAHVEAGLRSFDRTMPEEINRIVTDHVSDLLFVTEESGVLNLRHEGIPDEKIRFVGNTMIDSLLAFEDRAEGSTVLNTLGLRAIENRPGTSPGVKRYALLTLHRPSNVDRRDAFMNILEGLEELANSLPVVFPAHPRTRKRIAQFGLEPFFGLEKGRLSANGGAAIQADGKIHLSDPLGYLDFLCLMKHSSLVLTDSGGIQEETTCLGVPCVTIRVNTERPITVQSGTNLLAGVTTLGIRAAIRQQVTKRSRKSVPPMWDGKAALRIVAELSKVLVCRHSAIADRAEMQGGAARLLPRVDLTSLG